jgi:hypothetical protein
VLDWLRAEKQYPVVAELLALARVTMQVNLAVDARDAEDSAQRELAALLAWSGGGARPT